MKFNCIRCGKEFKKNGTKHKYCGRLCYIATLLGRPSANKGKNGILKANSGSFKKGIVPWNKDKRTTGNCLKCSKSFLKFKKTNKFCSKGCASSYRQLGVKKSFETCRKLSLIRGGTGMPYENAYINKFLRNTLDWKLWRQKVFERDRYTCQNCGKKGVYLEPHHIFTVKNCILQNKMHLVFDINNGISLCRVCHINKHRHKGE